MSDEKAYYTTEELKKRFNVSDKTLSRWRKRRKNPLPSSRFGRPFRYKVADVERWEEGLRVMVEGE